MMYQTYDITLNWRSLKPVSIKIEQKRSKKKGKAIIK